MVGAIGIGGRVGSAGLAGTTPNTGCATTCGRSATGVTGICGSTFGACEMVGTAIICTGCMGGAAGTGAGVE